MVIEKSKSILISVVVFGAVALMTGVVIAFLSTSNDSQENDSDNVALIENGPCSSRSVGSVLSRSVPLFLVSELTQETANPENPKKQFEMEQEITQLENYQQDANCLHILTMLYIDRGDALASERHLALLSEGLKTLDPESYILDDNANFLSIEDMTLLVEGIRLNEQPLLENNALRDQVRVDESTDE